MKKIINKYFRIVFIMLLICLWAYDFTTNITNGKNIFNYPQHVSHSVIGTWMLYRQKEICITNCIESGKDITLIHFPITEAEFHSFKFSSDNTFTRSTSNTQYAVMGEWNYNFDSTYVNLQYNNSDEKYKIEKVCKDTLVFSFSILESHFINTYVRNN